MNRIYGIGDEEELANDLQEEMKRMIPIEVLDKIRAEIMSLDYIDEDKYEGTSIDPMIDREDVLEIIDKYKAESERVNE